MTIERSRFKSAYKAAAHRFALFAALAMAASVLSPSKASAQELFSFLWDGGSRSVVPFSPKYAPKQIIVSFGDKKLYWIHRKGEAISYPIAIPREQSRWAGTTHVSDKRVNPSWTPTPAMLRENPRLPSWVPGGHPMNPLGVRALYLGSSLYRIHGTDAPWTIGQAVSKGCIRMFNEDVLDLYPRVPVGTTVTVTWERFKTDGVQSASARPDARSRPRTKAPGSAVRTSRRTSSTTAPKASEPRQTGFFIMPLDEANPPRPEEGMVTRYGRKVGGGAVARASQTVETSELDPIE